MTTARRTTPFLVALALFATAAPRLGGSSFLPEEAEFIAARLNGLLTMSMRSGLAPETLARLPSLGAMTLAVLALAATLAPTTGRWALLLTVAWSPAFLVLARHAGTEPFVAAMVAFGCAIAAGQPRAARIAGAVIALSSVALELGPPLPANQRLAGALAGLWGAWLGPALAPWRLEVVVPALMIALPLAWLGAGDRHSRRAGTLLVITAIALVLGATSPRLGVAPVRGAMLAPITVALFLRGLKRWPTRVPSYALAAITVTASLVALLNLHRERDLMDPARSVAWDEHARMLEVLCAGDTTLYAIPPLPAALRIYARSLPDAKAGIPARLSARALVVSSGLEGGLLRPTSDLELELENRGYVLAGEFQSGTVPTPLAWTVTSLTARTPAPSFLRIRRFERASDH